VYISEIGSLGRIWGGNATGWILTRLNSATEGQRLNGGGKPEKSYHETSQTGRTESRREKSLSRKEYSRKKAEGGIPNNRKQKKPEETNIADGADTTGIRAKKK